MANIREVDSLYAESGDVINLLSFIGKNSVMCGSNGITMAQNIVSDPYFVAEQFLFIEDQRHSYKRRVFHMILDLSQLRDHISPDKAYMLGMKILKMYPNYQSIFTVQTDIHIFRLQFVFNNSPLYPDAPYLTYRINRPHIRDTVDRFIADCLSGCA